ncbi:MAG: hypothetical protein KDK30_02245 [Leptospiraceae bacterium]|nr:hypothetical protein [Leptospiraceae bacterium]
MPPRVCSYCGYKFAWLIPLILGVVMYRPGGVHGQAASGTDGCNGLQVRVLEAGLARADYAGETTDNRERLAYGVFTEFSNFRYVRATHRVPLADGNWIHMLVEVGGMNPEREYLIRHVILHPPMRVIDLPDNGTGIAENPNGTNDGPGGGGVEADRDAGRTYRRFEYSFQIKGSQSSQLYLNWGFYDRYPAEMVSGDWKFQLYYYDCVLLDYKFTTYQE